MEIKITHYTNDYKDCTNLECLYLDKKNHKEFIESKSRMLQDAVKNGEFDKILLLSESIYRSSLIVKYTTYRIVELGG
ncbi:MAG: hypothetical protein ACRCXT_12710 [Paraclostridium sp.]